MDTLIDETKPGENQPNPFSAVLQAARGIANKLVGFFMVSEEERLQAGIVLRGDERDENLWR
jgi:hypothetical protein